MKKEKLKKVRGSIVITGQSSEVDLKKLSTQFGKGKVKFKKVKKHKKKKIKDIRAEIEPGTPKPGEPEPVRSEPDTSEPVKPKPEKSEPVKPDKKKEKVKKKGGFYNVYF